MRLSDEGYRRAMAEITRLMVEYHLSDDEINQLVWLADITREYEMRMKELSNVHYLYP